MPSDDQLIEKVFTQRFNLLPACHTVEELPFNERCGYVTENSECANKTYFFNYIHILYCVFDPSNNFFKYINAIMLLSLVSIAFLILSTTADLFFCPALKVISKLLYMNEHLAGVTLLAFGNGSPDIFTSFAAMDDDSRILFSDIFGAGMFVSCLVSGIIIAVKPFKLQGYNMLRDGCFFILGILFVDYAVISNNNITITESALILLIYCTYFFVVIMDQILLKICVWSLEKLMKRRKFATEQNLEKLADLRAEATLNLITRRNMESINIEATRLSSFNQHTEPNHHLFSQLIDSLNPFEQHWSTIPKCKKPFALFKAPMNFFLKLFLPCIDYELERHGWSKLLNTIQIVTFPFLIVLFVFGHANIFGVPLYCLTLIITIPGAVFVFRKTRTDVPPRFHFLYAIFTVLGAMYIIYASANETIELLYVLGLILHVSNSFLGCTILAWGNSVSDLVSNVSLAKHNYPRMAIAACFGGPIFNSLISTGLVWAAKTSNSESGSIVVPMGQLGETCVVFLLITILSVVLWGFSTNFVGRRSIGIFMCVLYLIFFLYATFVELEIMRSYSPEIRFDDIENTINEQFHHAQNKKLT